MNLMFWKRKAGAAEDAENAQGDLAVNTKPRESLDFSASEQDRAAPESSVMDTDSPEAPAKPGLTARLKLQLAALTGRLRKAPAFRAGEDLAAEASGSPEKSDADESPDLEVPARPGLLMRIKAGFAAFTRAFKAPAAPAAAEEQEAGSRSRSEEAAEAELPDEEQSAEPVRSRKWLIIGGSAVIAALLLFSYGIANWPISEPPPKRWGTRHDQMDISSTPPRPESAYEGFQAPARSPADVEALRKENAELQARIEALKRAPSLRPPRTYPSSATQSGASAPSSSVGGEMTIDSKDPKAAAMSLKEAIEAMNAGSGDTGKKPAR